MFPVKVSSLKVQGCRHPVQITSNSVCAISHVSPTKACHTLDDFQILTDFTTMEDHRYDDSFYQFLALLSPESTH